MIKLTFCLRRLPQLSSAEFQRYWLETHAPLVRKNQEALAIKRYVQTHAEHGGLSETLAALRGAPEPFDGVAELWFESREALTAAGASRAGRAAGRELFEDEKRFIDHARSPLWIGEEHEIVAA
jgi:uncharacterized protein (TIGR02118 family)